jgi:energy-converting hydrogenase Eha subunit G
MTAATCGIPPYFFLVIPPKWLMWRYFKGCGIIFKICQVLRVASDFFNTWG